MVTHAGIDGFSRLIVFMKCSSNNKAATVYKCFLNAAQLYGLPSRVRSDQGKENCLVAQHMLQQRGTDRNSMITGSSVHNQRIERLWKDMHQGVTRLYYRLFYYMEECHLINHLNDAHIYALHYVYVPRINRALNSFKESWNNHGLRTECNFSPSQRFVGGSLQLHQSGLTAVDFFEHVPDEYGNVEEGSFAEEESDVVVPNCRFELSVEQFEQLQVTVDPLTESNNYGIELYESTLQFIDHESSQAQPNIN